MTRGTEKGSFIPVTFALMPEAREAIGKGYSQLVANFLFDGDTIVPFGGEWDVLICRFETLLKENANTCLAAKHTPWKRDLWTVEDLLNDNRADL
jgi:hypothetical protein